MKKIKNFASYLSILLTVLLITNKTNAIVNSKNDNINNRVNKVRSELIRKSKSGDLAAFATDSFLKNKINQAGWGNWGNWANWNNWNNWANWANWNNWSQWVNY